MIPPGIFYGMSLIPKFFGSGIAGDVALATRFHIHPIEGLTIGGIGEANGHLQRVLLGLHDSFGMGQIAALGFDDGELLVAVLQHVVGNFRLAALPGALQPPLSDPVLPEYPAALHHTPASGLEGRIYQLGAGVGFIHGRVPIGRR